MTPTAQTRVPGLEALCRRLDAAVGGSDVGAITGRVKDALVAAIDEGEVQLPPDVRRPKPGSYARRLLHLSPDYSLLAMIWGPGQATPLHDHAGMWCVEGVLEGEIDVEQYDLLEEDGARYRFRAADRVRARRGAAGCLIPPFEYHTIANASSEESAITLHVYGGEMTHCTIFEPDGDGWHERRERTLAYD